MKISFTLGKEIKRLVRDVSTLQKNLKSGVQNNAKEACKVMVSVAKECTPHSGDGKPRGVNVITDSLQGSWFSKYTPSTRNNMLGNISLINNKKYALFVQNGHRVSRHFVPWLYKDNSGKLSYETNHSQKMFGLIVGTKTKYVKGVDMIGPAIDAFNRTFDRLNNELLKKHKI